MIYCTWNAWFSLIIIKICLITKKIYQIVLVMIVLFLLKLITLGGSKLIDVAYLMIAEDFNFVSSNNIMVKAIVSM